MTNDTTVPESDGISEAGEHPELCTLCNERKKWSIYVASTDSTPCQLYCNECASKMFFHLATLVAEKRLKDANKLPVTL